jgi:inner membrane protein
VNLKREDLVPSPIGHSLIGIAVGKTTGVPSTTRPWVWYAFAVVFANVADLDFLPGLFVRDINRFHHSTSHSLIAALLICLLAGFALQRLSRKAVNFTLPCTILYISHLVLDYFSADNVPPCGMPLLWPFSSEHYMSPVTLFTGVKHGNPGDSMSAFLGNIFSMHNLTALAIETLIALPVLAGVWVLVGFQDRRTAVGTR